MTSRKGKGTRRRNPKALSARALTIPELKSAFESVDAETHKLLKAGLPQAEQTKKFQAIWKSHFHRAVSKEAAESYLQVKRATGIRPVVKKGTRKMKGGAGALAGAPLDHMTGPGVSGSYGSFPAYQAQGLSFYNTINQSGIAQECGTKDFTPNVPETIGSNEALKGGGMSDLLHVTENRPIASAAPPGVLQDIQQYWQGRPLGASPAPEQGRPHMF